MCSPQFGVAVKRGCQAAVHATRSLLSNCLETVQLRLTTSIEIVKSVLIMCTQHIPTVVQSVLIVSTQHIPAVVQCVLIIIIII